MGIATGSDFWAVVTKRWADIAMGSRVALAVNIVVIVSALLVGIAVYFAQVATSQHQAPPGNIVALTDPRAPLVPLAIPVVWFIVIGFVAFAQIVRERMREGPALAARIEAEKAARSPKLIIRIERVYVNAEEPTQPLENPAVFVYAAVSNDGAPTRVHNWELSMVVNERTAVGTEIPLYAEVPGSTRATAIYAGPVDWLLKRANNSVYHLGGRLNDIIDQIGPGALHKGFMAVRFEGVGRPTPDTLATLRLTCQDYRHETYSATLNGVTPELGLVTTDADIHWKLNPPKRRLDEAE